MIFPFASLVAEHREAGLVIGTLIGFGFGFTLERAGFGRAQKLAAQFYGTDMTVFKVMFSAIVTALLGAAVLSGLGLTEFKALADGIVSPTYLWPMIIGGFVLGIGFIVSGYCPGTSFVAMASGKLDGLATVVGVIVGQILYAEFETGPLLQGFHNSSNLGHFYLWEWLHLPATYGPALLALGVTLMAVGCFLGAEKLEQALHAKATPVAMPGPAGRAGKRVFYGFGAAALAGLVLAFLPTARPALRQAAPMEPLELARRVLEEPWKLRVLDLRSPEAYAAQRIPGSESVQPAQLASLDLAFANPTKDLVVVMASETGPLPEALGTFPGRLLTLKGGFPGWKAFALEAPVPLPPDASSSDLDRYKFQAGLHAALTGMKAAPAPPSPSLSAGSGPKKGSGGCGG
jgi:uncharacterized membrane protein YedE/YeeE